MTSRCLFIESEKLAQAADEFQSHCMLVLKLGVDTLNIYTEEKSDALMISFGGTQ